MDFKTSRSVTLLLILLILVVSVGTVYVVTTEAREALQDTVRDELMSIACVAASQIDGDMLSLIGNGDEDTEEFVRIRDQLRRIRDAAPDLLYVYTMRKNGDSVEFVVDADYGFAEDAAAIGEPYPEAEPELHAGFAAPSVDSEFTTDQWGTVLSGFSPIRDASGTVVGIVGVDMDSTTVLEKLDFLNFAFYILVFFLMSSGAAGVVA
ncbi:MAG: HAMP domain-containing protein, partial [Methanomicrobiales archaeon]|nr:HAMP domain-containing protein [Methanomicrobiales archaeon]